MRSTDDDVDARAGRAAKTLAEQVRPGPPDARTFVERARSTSSSSSSSPALEVYGDPAVRRRRRTAFPLTAAAAVVAVVAGFVAFGTSTETPSPQPNTSIAPHSATSTSTFPEGSTSGSIAIFATEGAPMAVAEAYVRSRFPDFPAPGVRLDKVTEDFPNATVRWSTGDAGDTLYQGRIELRRGPKLWSVVRSTTDGVDLAVSISSSDGRLSGQVSSSNIDSLAVDVLDLDGEPVTGSPHPGGRPQSGSADYRFGTAGMGGGGRSDNSVEIDLPVGEQPVILRAVLVGGTVLSIAETVLDVSPASRVVDRGTWKGGKWEIKVSPSSPGDDGSPCAWIEVNGFRGTPSCDAVSDPSAVRQAATFDGESLYFAHVVSDVRTVVLSLPNRLMADASTVVDPLQPDGPRFAALTIPSEEPANASFFDADGRPLPLAPHDLHFPETVDALDAELSQHRVEDATFVQVRLRAAPPQPAIWLLIVVDGRTEGASRSFIVGSTIGTRVDLSGAEQVSALATTQDGTVLAEVTRSVAQLPLR